MIVYIVVKVSTEINNYKVSDGPLFFTGHSSNWDTGANLVLFSTVEPKNGYIIDWNKFPTKK